MNWIGNAERTNTILNDVEMTDLTNSIHMTDIEMTDIGMINTFDLTVLTDILNEISGIIKAPNDIDMTDMTI